MKQQKNLTDNLQDLPQWVQSEIKVLQMRLVEAKAEIDRMTENPKSNTVLGHNFEFQGEKIKYLENNQMVSFILTNGDIEVKVENDYLSIRAAGFSEGDMYIRPQVSNSIQIHLK